MEIRFDGKVVLITGAGTGIGAALARAFGLAGARVVVSYNRSEDEAQAVARDIEAHGGTALLAQADVLDPAQIDALVSKTLEHFSRIDILINNAGALLKRAPVVAVSDELYEETLNLNMSSVFLMCRRVVPIMERQGGGNIINISSISARNGGGGGSVVYSASKAAVSTFTRGLARELAGQNIRVNALSPGVILTRFHERFTEPEQLTAFVNSIPMGRAGTSEECVGAVFFLASDAMSSYVTGQIIEVNGGQYMP